MLTLPDLLNLLQLISSDRLTLRGNEAVPVAGLITRLQDTIEAAKETNGDGTRPTE